MIRPFHGTNAPREAMEIRSTWARHLGASLGCLAMAGAAIGAPSFTLKARHQTQTPAGSGRWEIREQTVQLDAARTAVVICDMWDKHWCQGATRRVAEMAPRMNEVVRAARDQGALIIHCPSDTMEFYQETPGRRLAQSAPAVSTKIPLERWCHLDASREAPLPIDDSDGGCDDEPQCRNYKAWSRQIETLEIREGDAVTDSAEAYYLMRQRGITNVIVMGVHLNMCVLGRPFSIRQMVNQGQNVFLARDLTDTMYNSSRPPRVPHCVGTDRMIDHVERFWCATVTSADFIGGNPFRFAEDTRPRVVFMIGEDEYRTWETLPELAQTEVAGQGLDPLVLPADGANKNQFPGLIEALRSADLLVVSVRRRALPPEQLDAVRHYLGRGKPLIGLRTSSHAFALRGAENEEAERDPARAVWPRFDPEVLGGNYQGHHGTGPITSVRIAVGAATHPILAGLEIDGLAGHGSLYRVSPLEADARALLIGEIPGQPSEPVAWTHTYGAARSRIFYTSLGHPEDFRDARFRGLLLRAMLWALERPMPGSKHGTPREETGKGASLDGEGSRPSTPEEALKAFQVPEDMELELVLSEPVVAQPLQLSFDERGRLWVAQYRQYPAPAGLDLVSHDDFWRAVYDKVPAPPPRHVRGQDRVTIHEDTDGDGRYDRHRVFVDGLNIATSIALGRGGVWVLNPPYLLFYPDRDMDDVPDGDPEVHLSGFGLEDTHSVVNSLRWGPDGWLYAAQGSTVSARVRVERLPGEPEEGRGSDPTYYSQGQNIWRYHPETRRYEVFAEGGGNAFGVEIDAAGRIFSGHNGGDTRGFHYMQGAYLRKGFEKHGPLSNPYAFGFFPHMAHPSVERFSHTFIRYEAEDLPERCWGRLFGVEPLQGRVVMSDIEPVGSTFQTRDVERPVATTDRWFKPVDIKVGPDGALYIADWYDFQINHWKNYQGNMDPSHGRVYRLKAKGARPIEPFDLRRSTPEEWLGLLTRKNPWYRQTALRLLGDRRSGETAAALRTLIRDHADQVALDALWALYQVQGGGFAESDGRDAAPRPPRKSWLGFLDHPNSQVRLWTIRLMGDDGRVGGEMAERWAKLAATEGHVEVRAQLACSAKRLPATESFPIVRALLARDEDAQDARQPMLLWWALESKAASDRAAVLNLFEDSTLWDWVLVRDGILDRLMRRYAAGGTREDLLACAKLIEMSPSAAHAGKLMAGFEAAFKGRSLIGLPEALVEVLVRKQVGSPAFRLRQGQPGALEAALRAVEDESADAETRRAFVEVLGEIREPASVPVLLRVATGSAPVALRKATMTALANFDDAMIGETINAAYGSLPAEVRASAQGLLSSRESWARLWVRNLLENRHWARDVPMPMVFQLRRHEDPTLREQAGRLWPSAATRTEDRAEAEIERLGRALREGQGNPYQGKAQYQAACSVCHTLFNDGGKIGPDLTSYQRSDLAALMLAIVNPNAEIREGYENMVADMTDGRSFSGFIVEDDPRLVVLRGMDGQNVALERAELARLQRAELSLMPEGLLEGWEDQQVRDLFAYLRSSQPLP